LKPLVLMVDHDVETVAACGRRFAAERPDLEFEGGADAEQALLRIRTRTPWVLVAAQRMPGLSGLELLLLARELVPSLPVVVMLAHGAPEIRQELIRHRSLEYLDKPFKFAALIAAIDRATSRTEGFSGNVSLPALADLIQMYAQAHTTGRITVSYAGEVGEIWFVDGEVVHAHCAGRDGAEAVYELVKWRGGSVSTTPGERSTVRSIERSWQQLLLEAYCRLDEARNGNGHETAGLPVLDLHPASARPASAGARPQGAHPQDARPTGARPASPRPASPSSTSARPASDRPTSALGAGAQRRPLNGEVPGVKESLRLLSQTAGFIGACVVDSNSGLLLGAMGGGAAIDLEVAAAGNTEVVRAKRQTMTALGLRDDIEDMLITLGKQYHLLRPASRQDGLFLYLVLDKSRANLALARRALADADRQLVV
jgi:DNA-binding NarL/FixJ family response regulator